MSLWRKIPLLVLSGVSPLSGVFLPEEGGGSPLTLMYSSPVFHTSPQYPLPCLSLIWWLCNPRREVGRIQRLGDV